MVNAECLSASQRAGWQKVLACLAQPSENGNAILIEGAAGTGKTYLLNHIMAYCDDNDIDAIAIGYTGIASCILFNGKTVHSQFCIFPWKQTGCSIDSKHRLYKAIRKASILLWDQAANCNRQIFEAVDQFLRTMMISNEIFGGKVVVVCGDFRECLPIARKSRTETLESHSLLYSALFNQMQKFHLHENQRFELRTDYRFCLEIGAGIQSEITVPDQCRVYNMGFLIESIYPNFHSISIDVFTKRSILSVHAEDVDYLNNECATQLCPNRQLYEGFNFFRKVDPQQSSRFYSFENTMNKLPSYFPPNLLFLDTNCPIILTQTYKGLSQGTRLVVKNLKKRFILGEVATGERKGKMIKIFKIKVIKPFPGSNLEFIRIQFPVALAFSLTINKAQGLEFDCLGLYLRRPAFSHGQMYTAFSRVRAIERDLRVMILQPNDGTISFDRLPNVVNQTIATRFLPINLK